MTKQFVFLTSWNCFHSKIFELHVEPAKYACSVVIKCFFAVVRTWGCVQLKDTNKRWTTEVRGPAPTREAGDLFSPEWCQIPRPGRERRGDGETEEFLARGKEKREGALSDHSLIIWFYLTFSSFIPPLSVCMSSHIHLHFPAVTAGIPPGKPFSFFLEGGIIRTPPSTELRNRLCFGSAVWFLLPKGLLTAEVAANSLAVIAHFCLMCKTQHNTVESCSSGGGGGGGGGFQNLVLICSQKRSGWMPERIFWM